LVIHFKVSYDIIQDSRILNYQNVNDIEVQDA